jgi:hypothetical protein
MFRLQRGGRLPSRNRGTLRGKKSLWFEAGLALRFHSTHPAAFPATGVRTFLSPLHI